MRSFAVWNNKGGAGKTFLSFTLASEIAQNGDGPVLLVDMCPQANLSEIVLGGNGTGSEVVDGLCEKRRTIGGYLDTRINSPHESTGDEQDFAIQASDHNEKMPTSLWLLAGDPSLEVQAQAMNQIAGQSLPRESWRNVHLWLKNLIDACAKRVGAKYVIVDCNPSFSIYTELAMAAASELIVPCSCDGSSARAFGNIAALLYGAGIAPEHQEVSFKSRMEKAKLPAPRIHTVVMNRSTQYSQKASKAFAAVFGSIKARAKQLLDEIPEAFVGEKLRTADVPDAHSVAVICSHQGRPLYSVEPGQYDVHGANPQVNPEPLDRYKEAIENLVQALTH